MFRLLVLRLRPFTCQRAFSRPVLLSALPVLVLPEHRAAVAVQSLRAGSLAQRVPQARVVVQVLLSPVVLVEFGDL
jgi:hypothetical protein